MREVLLPFDSYRKVVRIVARLAGRVRTGRNNSAPNPAFIGRRAIMKLCILPISLGLMLVVGLETTAWAQDKANFTSLQTTLKQQDDITLTTVSGDKVKGQMLDV